MDTEKTVETDAADEVAPEVEEQEEENSDAQDDDSSSNDDKEYEAIAEAEEKRADPVRAKIAFKERQALRQSDDDEGAEEDDADKPMTRREIDAYLAQRDRSGDEERYFEIARSMSDSDAEAKAVVATFKNRTFPANLSLKEQFEEAHAIVNRKKTQAKIQELGRSARSKDTVSRDAAGTHRDPPASSEPKMSAADREGIKSAGYVWDGVKRIWKKPLGGGRVLCMRDLKSPNWIEKAA